MSGGRMWLVSLAVSVGIFLIIYFTVIKDANDQANEALDNATQTQQELLQNANKQLEDAGSGNAAANKQIEQAQKLTQCLGDAGTDTTAIADCEAQFGG